MSAPQRHVDVSSWLEPHHRAAEITAWPAATRDDTELNRSLRGRISLAIAMPSVSVQLRPTIAEAHSLIDALEWAIAHSEVPA